METDCVLYQISGHTFKNIPVELFVSYDLSCFFLLMKEMLALLKFIKEKQKLGTKSTETYLS